MESLSGLLALPLNDTVDLDMVNRLDLKCLPFNEIEPLCMLQDLRTPDFAPEKWVDRETRDERRDSMALANFLVASTTRMLRKEAKARSLKVRRLKDLSRFMQLPPELVYHICEFLHPLDLIHLSSTSRSFRDLLIGEACDSIWRDSCRPLDALFTLPKCPPDVKYYDWVRLILGAPRCSTCKTEFAYPDFHLNVKLCTSCMGALLMQAPLEVDFLVVGTNRTVGNQLQGDSSENFTWPSLIIEMLEKVAVLQTGIATGVAGAAEAHEELLMTQNAIVVAKEEFVKECVEFMKAMRNMVIMERTGYIDDFVNRLASRFLNVKENNVDDVDFACRYLRAALRRGNRRNFRVTRRAYEELRPILEAAMEENRVRRLRNLRLQLISGRRGDILQALREIKRRLVNPADWAYWPESYDVIDWPEFQAVINDPSDTRLEMEKVEGLIEKLVQEGKVETWKNEQVEHLLTLLPSTEKKAELGDLDSATCIFFNSLWDASRVLIGRSEVMRGQCLTKRKGFSFSVRGRDAAISLLELVGVDPQNTRVQDVDPTLRFTCLHCAKKRNGKSRALAWEEAVKHFVLSDDEHHQLPAWHWLSVEFTHFLQQREKPKIRARDEFWSCNLCSDHFDHYVTKRDVLTHLWTKHELHRDNAVQDTHYVLAVKPRRDETDMRPIIDINAIYRCSHCPSPSTNAQLKDTRRAFTRKELRQHLRDKHTNVEASNEDEWIQKPVVRASTFVNDSEDSPV